MMQALEQLGFALDLVKTGKKGKERETSPYFKQMVETAPLGIHCVGDEFPDGSTIWMSFYNKMTEGGYIRPLGLVVAQRATLLFEAVADKKYTVCYTLFPDDTVSFGYTIVELEDDTKQAKNGIVVSDADVEKAFDFFLGFKKWDW